jgi:hypothetical protein
MGKNAMRDDRPLFSGVAQPENGNISEILKHGDGGSNPPGAAIIIEIKCPGLHNSRSM